MVETSVPQVLPGRVALDSTNPTVQVHGFSVRHLKQQDDDESIYNSTCSLLNILTNTLLLVFLKIYKATIFF